jgi:hypothetical protein
MSAKGRQEVLAAFSKRSAAVSDSSETEYEDDDASVRKPKPFTGRGLPEPLVMLISLKAGALGLNLTVANNVFLVCLPALYHHRRA